MIIKYREGTILVPHMRRWILGSENYRVGSSSGWFLYPENIYKHTAKNNNWIAQRRPK